MVTIHARTHVQLRLSCRQLLLKVQRRLRFTMQHVHSHAENLGNECADHAAALGAYGLVSYHDLSTRWARHSFDSVSRIDICHNFGDVWEKLRDIRTECESASWPDQELALCFTLCYRLSCPFRDARRTQSSNLLTRRRSASALTRTSSLLVPKVPVARRYFPAKFHWQRIQRISRHEV